MDDFVIQLQAVLDEDSVKNIRNVIQKYPAELEAKLNTAKLKSEAQSAAKTISDALNKSGYNVSNKQTSQIFNSYITQTQSLDRQLDKTIAKINELRNTKSIDLKVSGLEKEQQNLDRLGLVTNELSKDFTELNRLKKEFDSSSGSNIVKNYEQLNSQMTKIANQQKIIKSNSDYQLSTSRQILTFDSRRSKAIQDISSYLSQNTKLTKSNTQEARDLYNEIIRIQKAYQDLNKTDPTATSQFSILNAELATYKKRVEEAGLSGRSFGDQAKHLLSQFNSWFGISQASMMVVDNLRQSVIELKEIDTLITEISKANDSLSKSQLNAIADDSFDVASEYGKRASDYLAGVQEASRAGYQNATEIAELSTAAQGAGDMTAELANQMIIATDKAYKLEGSAESLRTVLDGMNKINKMVLLYRNIWLHIWLLSGKR